MNASELFDFLHYWLKLQTLRGCVPPWKGEIRVPASFDSAVREMHYQYSRGCVEIAGHQYRATRDWTGWMPFSGFPLILHSKHTFELAPRSQNTLNLVTGKGGQSPLIVADTPKPLTESQQRRAQAARSKWQSFLHTLNKRQASFHRTPMKTHTTTLLLALVAITTATLADTPDAILTDYRAKAAPALEKVNTTLEKATVPIIADLVKAGDTAGADEVKAQLKAKQNGEPVAKPHAKAASLFALYDSARLKALEPAQAAAIRRIDALLASSDGKKLEIVDAAKTVRAEIEAGKAPVQAPKIPVEWTYHNSEDQRVVMASVRFLEDGTFEMTNTQPGKWKANKAGDTIEVTFKDRSKWQIFIKEDTAVIDRPDIGQRYLRLKSQPKTATVAK